MKITLSELKQIIRQEVRSARKLNEGVQDELLVDILNQIPFRKRSPGYTLLISFFEENRPVTDRNLFEFGGLLNFGSPLMINKSDATSRFRSLDIKEKIYVYNALHDAWRNGKL